MGHLRYVLPLCHELTLRVRSGCLFASLSVARRSYIIFEIPRIFPGIRTLLRHTLDKRRGTLLCSILTDSSYVGRGGIRRP
jgi:hypothetical protein